MLELFRRATANNLTVEEMAEQLPVGPVAVIDKPESEPPYAVIDPLADGTHQYEVFNGSIATAGASVTFEASRVPDQWTVYAVPAAAADILVVNHGQRSAGPWVYLYGRATVVLPGRGTSITIAGATLAAGVTVVAIATTNLPVEVSPA